MTTTAQFILLAEYNRLMNQRQYQAAAELTEAELMEDKGAFFTSIFGTLNHILVGDILWLKRFAMNNPQFSALSYLQKLATPSALDQHLHSNLHALQQQREAVDNMLVNWAEQLSAEDINRCIDYTNMAGTRSSRLLADLITHLFLHQVHHRGQVTTLLSQCGIDFGETDLLEIIAECE